MRRLPYVFLVVFALVLVTVACASSSSTSDVMADAIDVVHVDAPLDDAPSGDELPGDALPVDTQGSDVPVADLSLPDVPPGQITFTRHTVDSDAAGAASAAVADIDGDGELEILVTTFGLIEGLDGFPDGELLLYKRGGDLDSWTRTVLIAAGDGIKFPGLPVVVDVDGDSKLDIVLGAGFLLCTQFSMDPCGALLWLQQTADGWLKHVLVSGTIPFYTGVVVVDMDGDGVKDLVTVAEQHVGFTTDQDRAVAQVFKGNLTAARFDSTPVDLADGMGSFPTVRDVDGDGDLDVVSAQFFIPGETAAWLENRGNEGWVRHVIDADDGPAIQLSMIPNLFGDGRTLAVISNHTNAVDDPEGPESAVRAYEVPADPTKVWSQVAKLSDGIVSRQSQMAPQQAPGVFGWGDIDGDGRIDLAVSGDGDVRTFWLQQTAPGTFVTHVLDESLGQAGGMLIVDLEGDGRNEIVSTGYEDDKVYVYHRD